MVDACNCNKIVRRTLNVYAHYIVKYSKHYTSVVVHKTLSNLDISSNFCTAESGNEYV